MEQSLSSQPIIFGYACLFGILLGAYYDIFRIIRILTASERRHIFFQDVFYLGSCGVLTFLFTFAANKGEFRFYILAGEIIGWCVYHLTVGAVTLRLIKWIVSLLEKSIAFLNVHFFGPAFRISQKVAGLMGRPVCSFFCFIKKSVAKSKIRLKQRGKVVYNADKRVAGKNQKKTKRKKRA